MTEMSQEEMRDEIHKVERSIMDRLNLMEDANKEHRADQARITERLTTVLLGEPLINHIGLVSTVAEHTAYIAAQKLSDAEKASEAKGEKRVLVLLGGIAGAFVTFVVQYLLPLVFSRGK